MPETPMHENYDTVFWENYVGCTREIPHMDTITEAQSMYSLS